MECRTLYYEDCHLSRFTARVTACEKTEKGVRMMLELSEQE